MKGVVVDVAILDVRDSFAARMARGIAQLLKRRGALAVVVGIQPQVAFSMVPLGMTLEDVQTALDLVRSDTPRGLECDVVGESAFGGLAKSLLTPRARYNRPEHADRGAGRRRRTRRRRGFSSSRSRGCGLRGVRRPGLCRCRRRSRSRHAPIGLREEDGEPEGVSPWTAEGRRAMHCAEQRLTSAPANSDRGRRGRPSRHRRRGVRVRRGHRRA